MEMRNGTGNGTQPSGNGTQPGQGGNGTRQGGNGTMQGWKWNHARWKQDQKPVRTRRSIGGPCRAMLPAQYTFFMSDFLVRFFT
nr:unnamed protein product [Haemonchus contortus]